MIKEIQYTTVHRVLEDLMDHPMLQELTIEQVVRYALKFISRHGYSKFYQDKIADVEIHEFRGLLPCDVISITQVKDLQSDLCMRSMTDNFVKGMMPQPKGGPCVDPMNNMKHTPYIPPLKEHLEEPSFKTQGQVIFTSFPEGMVQIAYRAIPVDDDGFPMLIDNDTYLDALEGYIKMKVFEVKFDQQKIPAGVFQNAQQQYYASAKLLQSEFSIPSPSEMESLARIWNTMIPRMQEFSNGFRDLGNREYLKRH